MIHPELKIEGGAFRLFVEIARASSVSYVPAHGLEHKCSSIQDRLISWLINLGTRRQFDTVSPESSLSGKTRLNREIYTTVRLLQPRSNDVSGTLTEGHFSKHLR